MCSGATVIFGLKAPLPEVISASFEQKGRDRQNHGAGGKTLGLSTTGWPVADGLITDSPFEMIGPHWSSTSASKQLRRRDGASRDLAWCF